ncbi:MAG TPA: helix-turn-helix transcriptional regulator, partial [Bacteroidia bacterium]|nr:helix-turn-helix transcriptional regulator [Bacteroidia bacterium]
VLRLKPAAPAPSVLPVFVESSDGPVGGPLPWKGSRAADFARCVGKSLSTHRPAACVGSDFVSLHPLPESGAGRAASSVCLRVILHRRRGRPPFTAGEIGPVHGLLSVLDRLYVADRMAPPGYGLAPRPREVFLMLLRGHARKEIADALGISLNTVHGYVRDIFRHFGVSSHAELVARFARSNPRCKAHAGMIGTGAGSPFPPSDTALS